MHSLTTQPKQATFLPFYWNGAFHFIFCWRKVSHIYLYLIARTDFPSAVILIWRLYALYNRSKFILYLLVGLFLVIAALSIGIDIYLYSRPVAFSGEFLVDRFVCKLTSRCIVKEIVTPNVNYCTSSFNIGPMPSIYVSIPIICFDIFLVVLAVLNLVKHLRERREIQVEPNTYVILIVRCHVIYFLLQVHLRLIGTLLFTISH